jgi:DNA-binding MarR family transcriptional regulator
MPETSSSDAKTQRTTSHPSDTVAADAWGALLKVHAGLVPLLDRELQGAHQLPLAWYDVLLELNNGPDRRLRMSELGERVTLSRTRVSRLVDEMSTAGLVRRDANPDDKRSAYAVLTTKGRNIFRQAAPTYLAGIDRHFGDAMSLAELTTVRTGLDKVIRRAERRSPA